jgi:hypothetical protein
MNQQQQIDIIQAHMDGKRVMKRVQNPNGTDAEPELWIELGRHYAFDFKHDEYKIEPRRVELFMSLPTGVLQAMARENKCSHAALVANYPLGPVGAAPGHIVVQINYLEP